MSDQFKTYRVTEKTVESSIIISFLLQPESGAVPGFCPGEYLIFDLPCDAGGGSIRRDYKLHNSTAQEGKWEEYQNMKNVEGNEVFFLHQLPLETPCIHI